MSKKKYNYSAGFSLVEFIVATFIFAVAAAGVSTFIVYYIRSYSFSFEEHQAISQMQFGLDILARELRETRSGDDGAWPLVDTQDNSITFFSDVTNDGRTDKVRYFLQGSELKKGVIEPTQVPVTYPASTETIRTIAYYVDNNSQPLFKYYNGNWPSDIINNPLISSSRLLNTRYISIYLRINVNPNTSAAPYELTTGVQLRSLKNNL